MKKWFAQCLPLLAVPLMVACGGGGSGGSTATPGTSTAPGTLQYPTTAPLGQVSLTAAQFKVNLTASTSGKSLYALASGDPTLAATLPCGVEVHKLEFYTRGAAAVPETVRSSGALMVPTGPGCTGPRPIVLYAHGTATQKSYDISALQLPANPANSESALVAAIYASNGFIVVAPNYAGYDDSTLGYHPYLIAAQQAGEMTDALAAARAALPLINTTTVADAGLLFVSGYSQGGYVAMAAVRHLEAIGQTVTASTPMSGPYALAATIDAIFGGTVSLGGTLNLTLAAGAYQHAYGNFYQQPTDLITAQYANGIENLLPGTLTDTQLFQQGLLPPTVLFDGTPTGSYAFLAAPQFTNGANQGFGISSVSDPSYLVTDAARARYVLDAGFPDPALLQQGIQPSPLGTNPIRVDLRLNDLRSLDGGTPGLWRPHSAMLLCAGGSDPVVFSFNTTIIANYFAAAAAQSVPGATPLVLNIDPASNSTVATAPVSSPGIDTQFAGLEAAFTQNNTLDATANGTQQAVQDYHDNVAPFCTAASAAFFKSLIP